MKIKNVIKHLVATLFAFIFSYSAVAFFNWNIQPESWGDGGRLFAITSLIITGVIFNVVSFHNIEL